MSWPAILADWAIDLVLVSLFLNIGTVQMIDWWIAADHIAERRPLLDW